MTVVNVLRRMRNETLKRKFLAEAQVQNALKLRIIQAEALLAIKIPGYRSTQGLSVTLRSENGQLETEPGAQARLAIIGAGPVPSGYTPKGKQQFLAEQLCNARLEAENQGKMRDGIHGTYPEVVKDLEAMLKWWSRELVTRTLDHLSCD